MAEPAAVRGFVLDRSDGQALLPGSLHTNRQLRTWLRFVAGRRVQVCTGKVEIGQGIVEALRRIAAEELDVCIERIDAVPASTADGPDEGVTSGSLSIQQSGMALRHACAQARQIALAKAGADGGAQARWRVQDGAFLRPDGTAAGDYWNALQDADLDVEGDPQAPSKPATAYRLVGHEGGPRPDLVDKIFGVHRFIHDLRFDAMLHGRVLRPPSPGAQLAQHALSTLGDRIDGLVRTVVDGRFVAVVARTEAAAVAALDAARERVAWTEAPAHPDPRRLADFLQQAPAQTSVPHQVAAPADAARPDPVRTHEAQYLRPYLAHASIGPSCAIARWDGTMLELWSHSQGIHNLRDDLCTALQASPTPLQRGQVTVHHVQGAGCYGHNGADDVAFDAALLALAVPGPAVRVLWSRGDELSQAPFGPAQLVRLRAETDADGRVQAWTHELWANGASSRPGRAKVSTLLAAGHVAWGAPPPVAVNAPLGVGGGSDRNTIPSYDFPAVEVINHRLDAMPIRASALRSLGAHPNVFASESFVDEIAHAHGIEPLEWRRRHLSDPRGRAVMARVIADCGWWQVPRHERSEGVGHGFAIARYKSSAGWCAVAARVLAAERLRVLDLDIVVDVGQVIDPDGVRNQVEGGAIQSASWTLLEQVGFDAHRITSDAWARYPILRFSDVPRVKVGLIDRPEIGPSGAGELAQGPVAAAIANALFDALGVRVRSLPLTPENILAAMQ